MSARSPLVGMFAGLLMSACASPSSGAQPKCPSVELRPEKLSPAVTTEAPASPTGVDEVEAELIRRINARDGRGIVALYGSSMAKSFPEEKTGPFFAQIVDEVGRIV